MAFLAGAPGLAGPRVLRPVLERVILELALAGLITDRTVEWVVQEQELHHPLARVPHRLGRGTDLHAVSDECVARDLELRHSLDLDLAEPAGPVDRELRMPAVVGNLDAVHEQAEIVDGLQDGASLLDLVFLPVDLDRGHV